MFSFGAGSLWFDVAGRHWGTQDCGVSPGGASDQLSFECARTLLGDPADFRCAEILLARSVTFDEEVTFVLTGARYEQMRLNGDPIAHDTVHKAYAGDTLAFEGQKRGFRLYLCATASCPVKGVRIGKHRGDYETWFGPLPQRIRVFPGPEYGFLENGERFFEQAWRISEQSSRMGLRLEGPELPAGRYDIVSSAVDDGTVQLTASGPIVLMRERQTTGGYPRVFQVAAVDLDLLAQYPPGSFVSFELITAEEARELLAERTAQFDRFKEAMK